MLAIEPASISWFNAELHKKMTTSSMTMLTRYGYDEDGNSCEKPRCELHGICVLQCLLNEMLEQRCSERRLHYSLQAKSLLSAGK